jgi:hypothetical protein
MDRIEYLTSKGFKYDMNEWVYIPKHGNTIGRIGYKQLSELSDADFKEKVDYLAKHTEGTYICLSATYEPKH